MGIKAKHIVIAGALVGVGVLWYKNKVNKWKETMGLDLEISTSISKE